MRRTTTTRQLQQAIKDNLLHITKAEKYSKSTRRTTISTDTFKDDLDFLCETIFADAIGWHYEYDIKAKQYIIETERMNGDVDFIFIAHLCACDGVRREYIDKALRVIEEE